MMDGEVAKVARGLSDRMRYAVLDTETDGEFRGHRHRDARKIGWPTFYALLTRKVATTVPPRLTALGLAVRAHLKEMAG